MLIPVAGSLITGFLLHRYFPNARGSGIPQTKAALFLHDGFIRFRTVLGKFGLCSVTLASGIALGREGPSVQVGAGIASVLGRRLGLSTASVKALVPIGASAALGGGVQHADRGGAVLARGSDGRHARAGAGLDRAELGDVVDRAAPGAGRRAAVSRAGVPTGASAWSSSFYAALGVVGGLVSVAFVKLLLWHAPAVSCALPQVDCAGYSRRPAD